MKPLGVDLLLRGNVFLTHVNLSEDQLMTVFITCKPVTFSHSFISLKTENQWVSYYKNH